MFKRRLRTLIDHAASLSGLLHGLEVRMSRGRTLLMYHRVLPEADCEGYPLSTLVMPEPMFREQVAWLAAHCLVLPVREALEREPRTSERPLVSITFDDGYEDNARVAAPILEAAGLRASFYLTTDFVLGRELWFDRATRLLGATSLASRLPLARRREGPGAEPLAPPQTPELSAWMEWAKRLTCGSRTAFLDSLQALLPAARRSPLSQAMSTEQVSALARRGHEIGSHTLSHPILPQLGEAQLERELAESRARILEWSGQERCGIAYPNGDSDERVRARTRAVGYEHALTTRPGRHEAGGDRFAVPRRDITPGGVCDHRSRFSQLGFRAELASFHELLR